jgi:archaellum biogenesis ATPase FlaH
MEFVDRFPSDVSKVNVSEEYRLLRLGRTATTLATYLASGQHGETTQEALAQYQTLVAGEAGEEFKERMTLDDFDADEGERIRLYPSQLSSHIGEGVHRGHNVTIFGRPNSGKSMLALNNAACLAKNGYKVLYVANEEPPADITRRLLSRMSKIDIDELEDRDTLKRAFGMAGKAYNRNWVLLHKAAVTAADIRRACARLRPDVVIVDQIKNVAVAEDNRALQLDKLARQVREIGIEFGAVTISVTQAGESAEGRLILGQTDVEWSNTGIPGAADLMIGIGVNDEFLADDKRLLTICKNKIKNSHGSFPVWIDPQRTLVSGRAL